MNYNTIVVGGGQAGLAIGYHLSKADDDFVILDAGLAVGESWRNRYDSLTLFTPSQYDSLPGVAFPGEEDAYPTKDQVADYLQGYAKQFRLPMRMNTRVTRISRAQTHFVLETTRGTLTAAQVVIGVGTMQCPSIPEYAKGLNPEVFQIHSSDYRSPRQLVPGNLLIVGAGNSGAQIAAELAGDRQVNLAVGKRPRCVPQRFLGRDYLWWLILFGMMDATPNSWPWGRAIRASNPIVGTTLRRLERAGRITTVPRVIGVAGKKIIFADGTIREFSNVIWATGYKHDFTWIHAPIFDSSGQLVHHRGVTSIAGLYFLGLRWLHTGGSGFLGFVGRDAAYLASQMTPREATRSESIEARGVVT
jgi:putative flavoprotein involved in K+ transport